jgi:hypothetical protein
VIRVQAAAEPPTFDQDVRVPGQRCLVERLGLAKRTRGRPFAAIPGAVDVTDIPSKKLEDYWTKSLAYAESIYGGTCAWYGLRIHPGSARTIDHFLPKEHYPGLAYEWSNYRLALLDANRVKGSAVGLTSGYARQLNAADIFVGFATDDAVATGSDDRALNALALPASVGDGTDDSAAERGLAESADVTAGDGDGGEGNQL